MKNYCFQGIVSAFMALMLTACSSSPVDYSYSRNEPQTIRYGTIQSIEPTTIEGKGGWLGGLAGFGLGSLIGQSVGGGRGSDVAWGIGSVAGAYGGYQAQKKLTEKSAVKLTVLLEGGSPMTVVQPVDTRFSFGVGEKVKVISQGNLSYAVKLSE